MSLLTELKRRGVFQAGVAYTVVAWLVVQVASIILPAFEAPNWTMQATIILLVAGFPITLVMAWLYDLTSDGLQKTQDAATETDSPAFPGQALNYVIMGILAAAVGLFTIDKFYWKTDLSEPVAGEIRSIAVLPFENLSGDEKNDPFAAGIHDDLLTQLSRISSLKTLSRTSVLRYANTELSIPQIAKELGVTTVLEGGIQRSEDRIRINAQLIDGETDAHLWAETYDRQLTTANIFAIQEEISRAITSAMRATLSAGDEQLLGKVLTQNLQAYEAYGRARARLDSIGTEDIDAAIEEFALAIELDAEFASAWAGLCEARLIKYTTNNDRSIFADAESACETALTLDDQRAEVHLALGTLYRYFGQYSRAEVALQRANYVKAQQAIETALDLNGIDADARVELGNVLARQGRLNEAEAELLRAAELEPGSWNAQNALFSFYYTYSDQSDRFESAARHAARSASLRPELAASWNNLGSANYMMANYELAADAWQHSLEIEPNRTAYTNTGLALYYAGNFSAAAEMQTKAVQLAPRDHRALGRLADALRFSGGDEENINQLYRSSAEFAQSRLDVNNRDWRTLGQFSLYLALLDEIETAREHSATALRLSDRNAETLYYSALVENIAGRSDLAIDLIEEALSKDSDYLHLIRVEPDFKNLFDDLRFQALLEHSRES